MLIVMSSLKHGMNRIDNGLKMVHTVLQRVPIRRNGNLGLRDFADFWFEAERAGKGKRVYRGEEPEPCN